MMLFWLSAFVALQQVHCAPTPEAASSNSVQVSDHVLSLKSVGVKSGSSRALLAELATGTGTLSPVESGGAYAIEVGLGGKNYDLIFDTGSSDLWVFKSGAKCVNAKGVPRPAAVCAFGPEFSGSFQDGAIPNENFYINYADGETLVGTLGYEDVTIAGVTVDKQEMALVDLGYWVGDGVVSGIVGFASKYITNAFPGTNPKLDSPKNVMNYNNFLTNAINDKDISPIFSVVIERGGGASSLTLGGIPSAFSGATFATTPIEKIELTPHPIEKTEYTYYTIVTDGISLDGESNSTTFPVIVDSGTTLLYLPTAIAEAVNAAFDPPSKFIESEGVFENYCNAKPPKFGITIGGTTFYINSADLLLHGALGKDPTTDGCVVGVQPGGKYGVLGDVFLKNVVAVFDVGAEEMKFAAHSY